MALYELSANDLADPSAHQIALSHHCGLRKIIVLMLNFL